MSLMNIAIVGDVHGHLSLMYAILGRWRREHGVDIDLILQLGDLGAFASSTHLDQATKRFAARDPEELGFSEFAGASPPATLLDPRPLLVFIPGNHEDFVHLEDADRVAPELQSTFSVSNDRKIHALRSGKIYCFEKSGVTLRIAGVSGVGNKDHKKSLHHRARLNEDHAIALAEHGPGAFDVLISHDAPTGIAGGPPGNEALRVVIDEVQPKLAFFAHYDWIGEDTIGATGIYGLGCCSYNTKRPGDDWPVQTNGFIMLTWQDGQWNVNRLVPAWLQSATRYTWRRWGRVDPKT